MKLWKRNVLLLALVAVLAAIPLLLNKNAEFAGADGQAMDLIGELDPAYEPWVEPVNPPASGEVESMLFALQAALGAGVLGFVLGRMTASRNERDRPLCIPLTAGRD